MAGGNTTGGKTIGILGGMGPEATADLFLKIIKATPAEKDQEHLRVVIDSNPAIPDRTAFILGKGEDPTPVMVKTAKNVESLGADLIAIPCNTAHYFHDAIQGAVKVPVLHIMREVARLLKGHVERVGILASTGTLKTELYERALGESGISVIVPRGDDQDEVMDAIYSVKGGNLERGREIALRQGARLVEAGAQAVIAGCTEIPLVLSDGDLETPVVDATKVLAEACVRLAVGECV
ncbi:MAG TPA: amino acid racemase [Firmicutes bacterium]|nr:amino acid racemase [Candidatus Fermentithermobacillaceae bacterium]